MSDTKCQSKGCWTYIYIVTYIYIYVTIIIIKDMVLNFRGSGVDIGRVREEEGREMM